MDKQTGSLIPLLAWIPLLPMIGAFINLTIGLLTPPVGTAMYVASNISGVPINRISKSLIPFWFIMIAVLMIVTYVPAFTTWVH